MSASGEAASNRLDMLLARHPLPSWRPVAWLVMLLIAAFLGWAYFARLDEFAMAPGEVVPQGKVKVIQHLEGGIIKKIDVKEGDSVVAGQPLVHLDLGAAALNLNELQARLDGQLLRRARLRAEAEGAPLIFPREAERRHPALARSERSAYLARREELGSELAVLNSQLQQKQLQVAELEARQRAVSNNLELARERLRLSQSLLAKELTPRIEHLQLRAEVENLQGEKMILEQSVPRAHAAAAEVAAKLKEAKVRFRRRAEEELGITEQTIARLVELLSEASKQGRRAVIRSPIDGVVKNMRYHTIGGVVKPGEPIMEIVPTGDRLVVEAQLSPTDRGYVEPGQRAVVKVTAYDFVRYGGLDGTVVHVAPDSSTSPNGAPYFRVIVETDKSYLGEEQGKLPISPGMQATVDIHTGRKSVLQYLLKPVLKLRHEAFREP